MIQVVRFVSAVVFSLAILGSAAFSQAPATSVVTETVREMIFQDQITLTGRTEAWMQSRIVAEVSGKVASIDAGEGVPITSGVSLVTIDARQIDLALKAKTAETEQARQRASLAADLLKRTRDLHTRSLISETALDSAEAWAMITEHEFEQLDAERLQQALDVERSRITAPFSGRTGRKLVDVGEWVSPGTPVFEMADISHIRVRVDLPERYYGRLAIGSEVSVTRSEGEAGSITGRVAGIVPSASAETHTFPVIIDVPNPGRQLAGGMLVRVTLSMKETFTSLAVSKDAIVRQGMQTTVYTVVDGKAAPIPVITGSDDGTMVSVTSEQLEAGMPVVVRGNERIFPGSPVNVAGAASKTDSRSETDNN